MGDRRPLPFDPIAEAQRQWEDHGWAAAAPGMAAVTSVMRAQQVFLSRVDALLADEALTFARYEVLVLLSFSRAGCLPLGKVGARLQVHPASVTNAVDRLEAEGLVRREPHPTDGRTRLATITPAGRQVVERATARLNTQVFAALGLSNDEATQLVHLLEKVRRGAGDFA
ncbi:MAG: MarR family transcriptional regulator [Acidimicrobiales bacterium]